MPQGFLLKPLELTQSLPQLVVTCRGVNTLSGSGLEDLMTIVLTVYLQWSCLKDVLLCCLEALSGIEPQLLEECVVLHQLSSFPDSVSCLPHSSFLRPPPKILYLRFSSGGSQIKIALTG